MEASAPLPSSCATWCGLGWLLSARCARAGGGGVVFRSQDLAYIFRWQQTGEASWHRLHWKMSLCTTTFCALRQCCSNIEWVEPAAASSLPCLAWSRPRGSCQSRTGIPYGLDNLVPNCTGAMLLYQYADCPANTGFLPPPPLPQSSFPNSQQMVELGQLSIIGTSIFIGAGYAGPISRGQIPR